MKKFLSLTIILLIILFTMSNTVFAAVSTKMEIVENNVCTINLNEFSKFEKKIVDAKLDQNQVTLQLQISNDSELIVPTGELMLVIDSSSSMNEIIEGTTTRKDLVLESANILVESLLKASSSLKIGVVTFSTSSETDDEGFVIIGTENDAQKVCDFTNDVETLKSKISAIEGTGQYTNLDSGLKLANSCFSSDDSNKYMIVLTDGLPNVAIGHKDLVTYDGLTDVINETKSTLSLLKNSNVELITVLANIADKEATFRPGTDTSYTYGDVIESVFGSEAYPVLGEFHLIPDEEIKETITNDVYKSLVPTSKAITDITVVDFFPQYIVDNFEMKYVEGIDVSQVSAEIDKETNSITWKVAKLDAGEKATIQYTLTLKENFDESIIGKILDTNQKVDINFKDFDGSDKTLSSDVTPKISLIDITPIPKAGNSQFIIGGFIILIAVSLFLGYKAKTIL